MRGNMSQQRYLLTTLLLLLAGFLWGQNEFNCKTGMGALVFGDRLGWAGTNQLDLTRQLSPSVTLELSSSLNATDSYAPGNPQKTWHNGQLGLRYTSGDLNLRASYRNLAFGSSKQLQLYPRWDPNLNLKRNLQHQGTISAAYSLPFADIEGYAQFKTLQYTPYSPVFDPNTFELIGWDRLDKDQASDYYAGLTAQVPLGNGLSVRLGLDAKNGLFADDGSYALTGLNGGLDAEYRLSANSSLSGSFDWSLRNSDAVPKGRRNLLCSAIRYQHRISFSLSGFLLYINNSAMNSELKQLRLISNYLRGHLQYSFPADPSGASYLLVGGKYSPEHKADAWFTEADYRIWKNLYAGASLNWQPDRQTLYGGKLSYYYTPVNELHLIYEHRENDLLQNTSDFYGLGSGIRW